MLGFSLKKWTGALFLLYLVNTGYIWAFAVPSFVYMTNVLIHVALGAVLFGAMAVLWKRDEDFRRGFGLPALLFTLSFLSAAVISYTGIRNFNKWLLYIHIAVSVAGCLSLLPWAWRKAREAGAGWLRFKPAFSGALAFALLFPAAMQLYNRVFPNPKHRIVNSRIVPTTMDEEGGGPKSPFFPSAAQTNVGGIIPSEFFLDSETCAECHKDIYNQWQTSMHHFASFNNQFYRKSIEYMQEVNGVQSSKWCAGCHDHAVFFNGRFDKPIKDQMDTPAAHAGLGCMSCHSISAVNGTMGNGAMIMEYPPLHDLANSKNPLLKGVHDFLTHINPEPHRRAFLKPFMRKDASEFCATCHKVHLDVPVNNFRWFRGFNDYDNWQASGVSGQGARSFYYPQKSSTCTDCHMPLVNSQDKGHVAGQVHNHSFVGANTAVPLANNDAHQMKLNKDFLTSGFISVDIFSVSPVEDSKHETQMVRRAGEGPQLMSSLPVGEEGDMTGGVIREVGKLAAPIDRSDIKVKPGSTVKVDVVVRTRKIGHFFPGGTVDGFDVWLELEGKDAAGKHVYWSGYVTEDGKGPVEPGAHFYKSYMLDGDGNPINKRNAWQARTVLYARLIPPGAADTAHFRIRIPSDAKGPITLTARLNHRKFAHHYTQFSYAGQPKPGEEAKITKTGNSAEYSFDTANIPANVSGKIKDRIPDIPITVLAKAEAKLQLASGPEAKSEPDWKPVVSKQDFERWNDWGIGLLLQGDLKGAEYAFTRVTEAKPEYADGWLNVARALIQEGETEAAKPFIQKALSVDSSLGRIHYFKALIEKADGDYDAAIKSLRTVIATYPRDKVVQNQLARILFLKREYKEALKHLDAVCDVDPEDVQMHYTAMLCYRGLNMPAEAAREQKLFQRFKLEESVQSITSIRRMVSPEDNNERQMIHDHESVPFDPAGKPKLLAPPAPAPRPRQTLGAAPKTQTTPGAAATTGGGIN